MVENMLKLKVLKILGTQTLQLMKMKVTLVRKNVKKRAGPK